MKPHFRKLPNLWLILLWVFIAYSLMMITGYSWFVWSGGHFFGGDYITFWARLQGLLAGASHAIIYDPSPIKEALALPHVDKVLTFPYPPHYVLITLPFGALTYNASVAGWLGLTGVLYLYAIFSSSLWNTFQSYDVATRRVIAVFIMLSPFAMSNIMTGQNGFLTAALILIGLDRLHRSPVVSGICFGLLTIKPQLGIMIFLLLIFGRHWKCIIPATLTALGLIAATTLWLGAGIWGEWLQYMALFQQLQEQHTNLLRVLNISLYRTMISGGMPEMIAVLVQLPLFIFAAWSVWRAHAHSRSMGDTHLLMAVVITASFIAAPHVLLYDMTIAIVPVLFLLRPILEKQESVLDKMALAGLLASVPLAYMIHGWALAFWFILLAHIALLRRVIRHPS